MSSTTQPAKGNVLRIIWVTDNARHLVSQLGPFKSNESRKIFLKSGNLTTEEIARQIREYAKLRDETLHTMRLLGTSRVPRNSVESSTSTGEKLKQGLDELEQIKSEYRDVQSKVDSLEKQGDESRKQISLINQVLETGFDIEDVKARGAGFTRILGRVPTRRLQDVQKNVRSTLNDQVVIAIGKQKGDWTHLLIAVPSDKSSLALQTLVLHDFSQTEVPNVEQPDLKAAQGTVNLGLEHTLGELRLERNRLGEFSKEANEKLNRLLDNSEESLVYLRALLRLGEGVNAEHAFAIPVKAPSPKVLDSLIKSGALFESG